MQELSMNVLDVAENSMRAQAKNVTIKVIEDSAADKLTILIEDDGCGMSEEQIQTLKERLMEK